MKTKLITFASLLLMIILISSCETTVPERSINGNEKYSGMSFSVIEIDSCEYVMLSSDIRSLTHKGNCQYCKNRLLKILNH